MWRLDFTDERCITVYDTRTGHRKLLSAQARSDRIFALNKHSITGSYHKISLASSWRDYAQQLRCKIHLCFHMIDKSHLLLFSHSVLIFSDYYSTSYEQQYQINSWSLHRCPISHLMESSKPDLNNVKRNFGEFEVFESRM